MEIVICKNELYSLFAPFISKRYNKYDLSLLARIQKERISCFFDRLNKSSTLRSTAMVKKQYDKSWKNNTSLYKKDVMVKWGEEFFSVNMDGIAFLHLFCIKKIIDFLNPVDIFEVGFGKGGKLIPLAASFHDKKFGGIELSTSGFEEAIKIIQKKILPDELKKIIPFDIGIYDNFESIDFFNGSAENLPVSNKSYDLVYTSQALEQMEPVRDIVVPEIVRIAKKYVLMIEPFRDWNNSGMHRNRIISRNYFEAKINDLPKYGLKPIYTNSDLPSKIYMNVGIVLAEVL